MQKHLFQTAGHCSSCPGSSCHTLCHLSLSNASTILCTRSYKPLSVQCFILKGLVGTGQLSELLSWGKPGCTPDAGAFQVIDGCRPETQDWRVQPFSREYVSKWLTFSEDQSQPLPQFICPDGFWVSRPCSSETPCSPLLASPVLWVY